MRTSIMTNVGLIAFAATSAVHAATSQINNYCHEPVWLTFTNGTGYSTGPLQLPSGEAFKATIIGVGNSLGVTKTPDYWSSATPKLIFGTSDDAGAKILYWTVSSVDGDPMKNESFNVTSVSTAAGAKADVCQHASSYDGQVHSCQDADVALVLDLC